MKRTDKSFFIVPLTLAVCWQSATAEIDLFVPVDDADAREVIQTDRRAALSAYFGQRIRLVTINPVALSSDGPIRLELFPDVEITVERVSFDEIMQGGWSWKGQIIEPRRSGYLADGRPLTAEEQRELEDSINRVSLSVVDLSEWGVHPSVEEAGFTQESQTGFSAQAPQRPPDVDRSLPLSSGYQVQGRISSPALQYPYRIRPVVSAENYHVVIEVDRSRTFRYPHPNALGEWTESEENASRRLAYEEFRRSLDSSNSSERQE